MFIGGLQRLSLTDYPECLSAIIFTRGCNFCCPYCHNPELVDPARYAPCIPEKDVFSFLQSRRGRLDGVVVTGGEPTIHEDLPELLGKLKALGFSVKLDTNGSLPDRLEGLLRLRLLDYVAIDIKASASSYKGAVGAPIQPEAIRRSVELVVSSGLQHEVRLTVVDPVQILAQTQGIADLAKGCRVFFVQPFQPSKTLDSGMLSFPRPSVEDLEELRRALSHSGLPAVLRAADD